jgi:hypothetical protein
MYLKWSVVFGSGQMWLIVIILYRRDNQFWPLVFTCWHLKKISWIHPPSSNLCIPLMPNPPLWPMGIGYRYVVLLGLGLISDLEVVSSVWKWSVVFGNGQLWSEVVSSVWKWSYVVNSDHFVPKGQSILTTCSHLLTLKKISWIHPPSSNLCIPLMGVRRAREKGRDRTRHSPRQQSLSP